MRAIAMGEVEAMRRRHPCLRAPLRCVELHERVADDLGLAGAQHPDVAASLLAARGAAGLRTEPFARRTGVDVTVLRRAEAGELSVDELPQPLRELVRRP
jgi:hypothetical protein